MSMLSKFYKKNIKPIKNTLGKLGDAGSDFLPPGFRDAGNFVSKRLQGQSTKQAAIGTAMDYAGGKINAKVSGKMQPKIDNFTSRVPMPKSLKNNVKLPKFDIQKIVGRGATDSGRTPAGGMKPTTSIGSDGRLESVVKGVRKMTGGKPITLKNTLGGAVRKAMGGKPVTIGNVVKNLPKAVKGVGGWVKDNAGDVAAYGAAGLAGVNAAKSFKRAGDLRNQATKVATDSYAERAPLRARGVSGMMKNTINTAQPDDLINTNNPFAKKKAVV